MERDEHIARCLKVLGPGQGWPEVHDFLDQYFDDAPGSAHRIILHHKMGVEIVVQKFGEAARAAAELHIRDDLGGELPENPQDVWNRVRAWLHPHALGMANAISSSLGLPQAGPWCD